MTKHGAVAGLFGNGPAAVLSHQPCVVVFSGNGRDRGAEWAACWAEIVLSGVQAVALNGTNLGWICLGSQLNSPLSFSEPR